MGSSWGTWFLGQPRWCLWFTRSFPVCRCPACKSCRAFLFPSQRSHRAELLARNTHGTHNPRDPQPGGQVVGAGCGVPAGSCRLICKKGGGFGRGRFEQRSSNKERQGWAAGGQRAAAAGRARVAAGCRRPDASQLSSGAARQDDERGQVQEVPGWPQHPERYASTPRTGGQSCYRAASVLRGGVGSCPWGSRRCPWGSRLLPCPSSGSGTALLVASSGDFELYPAPVETDVAFLRTGAWERPCFPWLCFTSLFCLCFGHLAAYLGTKQAVMASLALY